jgi:hypothetical protein
MGAVENTEMRVLREIFRSSSSTAPLVSVTVVDAADGAAADF